MAMLKLTGMIQSMSRKGNCFDNAVAESFFSTLSPSIFKGRIFRIPSQHLFRQNSHHVSHNRGFMTE